MLERKLKNKLTDEKGSGLVLALMVLLVLSVLGASLGVLTIGSLQLSTVTRDTNSAYYIAEAGANLAYEEFENIVWDSYNKNIDKDNLRGYFESIDTDRETIDSIIKDPNIYPGFDWQFGDKPSVNVTVDIKPNEIAAGEVREYVITSTGEVAGKKRIVKKPVTVTWVVPPKQEEGIPGFNIPKIPEGVALISNDKIIMDGGSVTGDVYLINENNGYKLSDKLEGKETVTYKKNKNRLILDENWIFDNDWTVPGIPVQKPIEIDWTEYEKYQKDLNEKNFKDLKLSDLSDSSEVLNGNYRITESQIEKGYEFKIGSNDVTIFVDRIHITSGSIKVKGSGSLTLIVSDTVTIGKDAKIGGSIISGGAVSLGEDSEVTGSLISKGAVSIGKEAEVGENVTAGGAVVLGKDAVIKGNLTSAGSVTLEKDSEIKGNLTSAGSVTLGEDTEIKGNLTSSGSVALGKEAEVKGNVTSGGAVVLGEEAEIKGNVMSSGAVTLEKDAKVKGSLISGETVSLGKDSEVIRGIISGGAVTIGEEAKVNRILLAKGNIEIKKEATVTGSVVGKDITIKGKIKYKKYDTDNSTSEEGDSPGELNKISIEELIQSEPALESDE